MTQTVELGPDYDPIPYILPDGPVHDREICEGWSRWRRARHDFVPAPRISLAAYLALTPHRRMLYDLHRTATHANLPILETPMSAALTEMIESRIKINAFNRGPSTREGIMVSGGGFQGKTETVCEIAAAFEDFWWELNALAKPKPGTRDLMIPVAYVQTPVTAKPKSTCEAILEFYGAHIPKTATLPQLMRTVRACLKDNQTKVLILDDITRLRLHRADDQDVFDLIRSLMSMQVTLILVGVGIRTSGLLRQADYDPRTSQWIFPARPGARSHNEEAETQHERRFNLLELDRFRYDTVADIDAWVAHLAGLEEKLCLLRLEPGMLTDGDMPEYLYRRTNGIVGLLSRLIGLACERAMASNGARAAEETLSKALLDTITINPYEVPGRDPNAGEIPDVPEHQPRSGAGALIARKPSRPKRRRNGSFDDTGLSASSG
jgi:hypothetical protein